MINITLKCQEKHMLKKITIFTTIRHGFWFLNACLHPYYIIDVMQKKLIRLSSRDGTRHQLTFSHLIGL